MNKFKTWVFFIPIIGELYLLTYWGITDKYPLKMSENASGMYQGFWIALLILMSLL